LFRQMGSHSQAFRALQRALKIARQKQGLEVMEAATLINMGAVLMSQGQLLDAITIIGAALSMLSKHEVEAALAWQCEVSIHNSATTGEGGGVEIGGRAGRSARINAIGAMVAMAHHNLGAMHEAARRLEVAKVNYDKAHELAHQYLGPSSHIASIIAAALSAQGCSKSKGRGKVQGETSREHAQEQNGGGEATSPDTKCAQQDLDPEHDAGATRAGAVGSGRRRPAALQTSKEALRSPDAVHRSLVEEAYGYVHWGHAPTGLRLKVPRPLRC